jgi:hypothetical protein
VGYCSTNAIELRTIQGYLLIAVQVIRGMIYTQATIKIKYYDHIVLLYLESRRCRYRSIIFVCSPVCQTCLIDLYQRMTEQFRPELFDDSDIRHTIIDITTLNVIAHIWQFMLLCSVVLYSFKLLVLLCLN